MAKKIKFMKGSSRLTVKFVQAGTNKILFEIKDRDWMNIGELFTDHYVDQLLKQTYGHDAAKLEKIGKVIVLVTGEYDPIAG
ncbi:MAG: hypothetical protein HC836_43815 [Richelia sp. RM2_1_2]|nr:hypothetical protein [Richelia sp. RM2_1_2]